MKFNKMKNSIYNSLEKIIQEEIDFSGSYISPLEENKNDDDMLTINHYLDKVERSANEFYQYVHSWVAANPSDERTIARSKEIFVYSVQENSPGKTIANAICSGNTSDLNTVVFNIEKEIIDRKNFLQSLPTDNQSSKSYYMIIGNRGIGKTTFFNVWLNHRSDALENQKLIWFRIDASKLYTIWKNWPVNNIKFEIDEYHAAHTVYVVCKYGKKIKKGILADTYKHISSIICLKDSLDEIDQKLILVERCTTSGKDMTVPFLTTIIDSNCIPAAKEIYYSCVRYWEKNNIKQLLIIDGIDNLTKENGREEHYQRMLYLVSKLFPESGQYSETYNTIDFLMLVIRPETKVDLYGTITQDHPNFTPSTIEEHYIYSAKLQDVLQRKANIVLEPQSEDFKSKRNTAISHAQYYSASGNQKALELFSDHAKWTSEYIKNIHKSINQRKLIISETLRINSKINFVQSNWTIDDVLTVIFDNNLRACVNNFLNVYKTIYVFFKKNIPYANNIERYMQYVLLNGDVFYCSDDTLRKSGKIFPNIFWWDKNLVSVDDLRWHGLIGLRIFQLIAAHRTGLHIDIIKKFFNSVFSLGGDFIDEFLSCFMRYGLVKKNEPLLRANRTNIVYKPEYSITSKGKFYYNFMFMYSYWLYYFALDTPLDAKLVVEESRYIILHRSLADHSFIELFNVAFIKTVLTFSRHIMTQHKLDMQEIDKKFDTIDKRGFGILGKATQEEVKKWFTLPDYFIPILKYDINTFLKGLLHNKTSELESLYLDLKGLYSLIEDAEIDTE